MGRGRTRGSRTQEPDRADDDLMRMLYDEHAGPLYAFCLRWTHDPARAEDVVQEVFLRAWRTLPRLDVAERPVRPWLLTVARNLLNDQHRAAASRPQSADEDALASVAAPDDLDRAVQSWQVIDALRRLTPEHREVLIHAHWMGRSVAETAALLGVPPGTVKSRTYYALRALRLVFEEQGIS